VPDQKRFFADVHRALKPGARLLFREPRGHVSAGKFAESLALAKEAGFTVQEHPITGRSRSAVLTRP